MNKPKTQLQEVLFELINEGKCSIRQFFFMCGFRTRISELNLKHGLSLDSSEREKEINTHGNTYSYPIHKLPKSQRKSAIEIYKQLTSQ